MNPKPIAVQLYSVREAAAKDLVGVLEQIAAIGYAGVELAGLHGNEPGKVRKILDELGMVVSSAHVPLATPESINEVVETAGALGYKSVITGKGPETFKSLDLVKAAAEECASAAELLKSHGLQLVYHNHWWEMDRLDGRSGLDILLELAADLKVQIDVYWASNFGVVDVPALVGKYAGRLPIIHLKDGPLLKGRPQTAVGSGKMDIPACVEATDPNVLEWLVVELDDCATDMMEAVRESHRYLTGLGLVRGRQ